MFPIIPQLLPNHNPATISSNLPSTSKSVTIIRNNTETTINNSAGVIATCDLYPRLKSQTFRLSAKKRHIILKKQIKLTAEQNTLMPLNKKLSLNDMIEFIKLADDCHSFNVQVSLNQSDLSSNDKSIYLEVIKPIKAGEQLLLWFSEEILTILQMAFLTPANIQGQKKYVCHKCNTNFEYPNPLKLHLTLNCNQTQNTIWSHLKKCLNTLNSTMYSSTPLNLTKNSTFKFELESSTTTNPVRRVSFDDTTLQQNSSNSSSPLTIIRPLSEPSSLGLHQSAFQPYSTSKTQQNLLFNNLRLSQSLTHFPTGNEILTASNLELSYNHAAQMETLVSNLGKSKQGHLCIYCGKLYSRKYGLKIHIRTHTGFKPLKCKYCLRPFGDPSNLNKHVRLHAEGETPYKCDLCGKILVRKRDLNRHLKSRHLIDITSSEQLVTQTQLLRVTDRQ